MASLSLPRVLQLKKNSLDAEREHFEKNQTLAIQKAINSVETPVKEKHVRSAIIGTFQEQSAITYWMVAIRLPLQDNRIVAWKFCHVTHKLLREGHPACLDDSQRHIGMIENLGKLWVHLREGYGRLVSLYCNLLVVKLKFHARNPRFPGNMQLTADELDNIAENDVNNYFQICVELFDYMDEILNLQAAVFDSLGNARANSMTASGQCRLAALIPCAQDSSQIYDCNVRLLFRLHASLPADTLAGHRERFRQQFKSLSSFYKHASSLQYYRNLLSLPVLPANPPNFLLQSDFGTYVAPVVSIPEPPPDEVDAVGSLIDTSDTVSQMTIQDNMDAFDSRTTPSPQPDPVVERDRLIDHLQNELKRMRAEVSQMVQERNTMMSSMREHCAQIETELQTAKTELREATIKAEVLQSKTPEMQQKLTETEEKAKLTDEKFQKLKGAYTQLREEHIALIRQKAEVDKMATSLRAAAAQHESAKTALQQQLNDRMKDVELLQQSASSSEEIEAYKSEIASLRTELERARQTEVELETLKASMEALEIEHKTASTEQNEQLTIVTNELKEVSETLERVKQEKEDKEIQLKLVIEELSVFKDKVGGEYQMVSEEKDAALKQLAELKQQYQQEKQDCESCINNLKVEIKTLELQLTDVKTNFESQYSKIKQQLHNKIEEKDLQLQESLSKLSKFEAELKDQQNNYDISLEEQDSIIDNLQKDLESVKEHLTEKDQLIKALETKRNSESSSNEKLKLELEKLSQQNVYTETILKDKLDTVSRCKDEVISDLKNSLAEKDDQVISLTVEVNRLQIQVDRLQEELNETQAELEIGKNEMLIMKEEHDDFILRNKEDLESNNNELKSLLDKIKKLSREKNELIKENNIVIDSLTLEKEEHQNKINELETNIKHLIDDFDTKLKEKLSDIYALNVEVEKSKSEYVQLRQSKENEINEIVNKLNKQEIFFNKQILDKDEIISECNTRIKELSNRIEELDQLAIAERQKVEDIETKKNAEIQIIEARLEHTESQKLNAECELQDLLQHNTILEADLAATKIQLDEAKKVIEQQTRKLVSCSGDAAIEMTNSALAALERGNAQETNKVNAEKAAQALEQLSRVEVKGNEESIALSAISAAHNTATLSAYVTEICNVSTDLELSDKLNHDCRLMLTSTKQCLESIRDGQPPVQCVETRDQIQNIAKMAASADRASSGSRSVDDELADMDKAIEQAASQIEEMLAASRAGDSGLKLEVNGKILDACTTLMGAVKILVQDARKLQNELGDPKTRQKMYRRNPQWSQGLISAAKAVVFAAKLLVTSADEAVSASGRFEGVSAAAHEVAGSTAQLVAASRARAPPASPALARLTAASRSVAAATGAVVAAVRASDATLNEQEALDTSALTLTATRRLEMESKVRSLELESALDAERARLHALRKRHYVLAQQQENGNITNGKQ